MSEKIIIGGVYKHFKGENKLYRVLRIAKDCEDVNRDLVVYEQLYDTLEYKRGTTWARELSDFVGFKEFPDGRKVKRFELVDVE